MGDQRKLLTVPNQTDMNKMTGRSDEKSGNDKGISVSVRGEVISDMKAFLARKRLEREQKGGERNGKGSCRNLYINPAEHKPNLPEASLPRKPTGVELQLKIKQGAGAEGKEYSMIR